MPQHITLAEVRAKALKAYKAKKLIAQSPFMIGAYKHGRFRCAIGAALTMDTLKAMGEQNDGAITDGFVTVEPSELDDLRAIQHAHDYWVMNKNSAHAKGEFLTLLMPVAAKV